MNCAADILGTKLEAHKFILKILGKVPDPMSVGYCKFKCEISVTARVLKH